MVWLDIVVIAIYIISTPISIVRTTKEAQRTGRVASLFGSLVGAFLNIYVITRLWP